MRISSLRICACLIFVSVFAATTFHVVTARKQPAATGYHLKRKIEVGGEGGWDYLFADSGARRLYVSHATKVVVIDLDAGTILGEIAGQVGVHGIAVATEFGKGFISDGRANAVTIFDLKTLKVTGTAKTGRNPDAIIYDPASKRVFAFDRGSSEATAIDASTGEVVSTFALDGTPEFAVADGKGMIYANLDNKNVVAVIDSKKLTVNARWTLTGGEGPSGLAFDPKTRRLFSVCGNKTMVIMDANDGHVVTTVPIGSGCDAAAFDPGTNLAFASNGDGTLTVVHEDSADKFTVVENAATQARARTMAVDLKTHHVFVATAQFGPTPPATTEQPRPRAPMIPNSFVVLEFER